MGERRTILAIDGDTLHAVEIVCARSGIAVKRGGLAKRPPEVEPGDADAVGIWIASACGDLGVGRKRVSVLVPRDEHVAALVELPGAELSEAETVGLVRHRVSRASVPLDDDASIDFVHLPVVDAGAQRDVDEATQCFTPMLLGVGMPAQRLAWYRDVAGAAGLGGCRLEPLATGVAALAGADDGGSVRLVVSIMSRSAHLVVARDGEPLFARRVVLRTDEAVGERIAIEALRTLSAYRVSGAARFGDPIAVLIAGPEPEAVDACRACAIDVGLPAERAVDVAAVTGLERLAPGARWRLAALASSAAASRDAATRHDFFAPREAPDQTAKARQGVLVAAFLLIAVIGVVFVVADGRSRSLERQIDARSEALRELRDELEDLIVRGAKAQHAQTLIGSRADWGEELGAVAGAMPGPEEALLDSLHARMTSDIVFQPGDGGSFRGTWQSQIRPGVRIAGQSGSREAALALREALLAADRFGVRPRGADTADRFDLELDATRNGGRP